MINFSHPFFFSLDDTLPIKRTQLCNQAVILNKKEKDKYHFTYMCNLKYGTSEPVHKTARLRHGDQTCGCQGRRWRREDWEFGIVRCKVLYTGWINKVLLYSRGNYVQYPVTSHNRKEYKKNKKCFYEVKENGIVIYSIGLIVSITWNSLAEDQARSKLLIVAMNYYSYWQETHLYTHICLWHNFFLRLRFVPRSTCQVGIYDHQFTILLQFSPLPLAHLI